MKSMFQIIAAAACALALTACGGGGSKTAATPAVVQPDFKKTDLTVGTGTEAAAGDLVVVNFTGWLYDSTKPDFKGSKVESSVDTGIPAAPFVVGVGAARSNSANPAIVGWDQIIVGMKVGGKRNGILPANLAYGSLTRAALPAVGSNTYVAIPSNSALVYDIELVSVTKVAGPVNVPPLPTLVIQDTVVGTVGTAAVAGKAVTLHYTGWLYDGTRANLKGTQFDTDTGRTTPLGFTIGDGTVIKGMDQGVTGMLVGGKRTITIPPDLAYGTAGSSAIPPNATLIFEVEMLTVK